MKIVSENLRKNIILIPPCFTYGDCHSVIGVLYYLLEYYQNVYFFIGEDRVKNYYQLYFSNDPLNNNRIFIISDPTEMINNGQYGEYDVCNTAGDWESPDNFLKIDSLVNIDKSYYFSYLNPLYNKLDINEKYKLYTNKYLARKEGEKSINHIVYYELLGLNNNVRMEYFNYVRNLENELNFKSNILKHYNCIDNKYNIINDPIGASNLFKQVIDNDYPIINISNLSECVGDIILLVEGAETINFIESNNTNFFYHSQYKGIFNYVKKINLHVWMRDRDWSIYNMDNAWKMTNYPKLENWEFVFKNNI